MIQCRTPLHSHAKLFIIICAADQGRQNEGLIQYEIR